MPDSPATDLPRIFVCYAREDRSLVYPEVDWLRKQGFDVHIDRHITPGVQWMEAVADAIAASEVVLYYGSARSAVSDYCAQEIRFALNRGIRVISVKLEPLQLPPWMELALGDHQMLERFDLSQRSYRHLLLEGLSANLKPPGNAKPPLAARSSPTRWKRAAAGFAVVALIMLTVLLLRPGESPLALSVQPFVSTGQGTETMARRISSELADGLLKLDLMPVQYQEPGSTDTPGQPPSHTLGGEIDRSEEGFTVRATLTDAKTGEQIWSQSWLYVGEGTPSVRVRQVQRILRALPDVLIGTQPSLDHSTAEQRRHATALSNEARGALEAGDNQANAERARRLYLQALDEQPGLGEALLGLCQVQLLEFELRREVDLLVDAETRCLQALAVGADAVQTHLTLGDVFVARDSLTLARTHFQRAGTLAPDRAEPLIGLAEVAERGGDDARAGEYYERAVTLPAASWRAFSALGRYFISRGEFSSAAEQYERLIELVPDSVTGYANLGACWFYLGKFERAGKAWHRAIELEPDPVSWGNLGAAFTYQRNYSAAAEAYRSAADMAPQDHRWWGHLGEILTYDGNPSAGREYLERARALAVRQLQYSGNDPDVLARLSTYDALLGEDESARKWIAQARSADAQDFQVLYAVLQTLTLLGESEDASRTRAKLLDAGYPRLLLDLDPWLN
jgi:tetratricopeptide (TPR) repeat protein